MISAPNTSNLHGVAQGTGIILVALVAFLGVMLLRGETESYLGAVIYLALLAGRLLIYLLIAPRLMLILGDESPEAL